MQTCPYAISPLPPPHPDLGAAYLFPDPGKVACHLERGFQGLNAVELLWQGPLPDEGMELRVTGGQSFACGPCVSSFRLGTRWWLVRRSTSRFHSAPGIILPASQSGSEGWPRANSWVVLEQCSLTNEHEEMP